MRVSTREPLLPPSLAPPTHLRQDASGECIQPVPLGAVLSAPIPLAGLCLVFLSHLGILTFCPRPPLFRRWTPGAQCITKCEHTRPKPGELAFRKGDVVTILEACENKSWYRAKHHTSGQEGLLAAGALREREALSADPKLSLMPWFHGKISGQEAVQQLQPPEDGLFLVRESARHPGDYVLCVSFGRDVIHYRVLHRDGHLTIDEAVFFCNLMDMVEVLPPGGPTPSLQGG
ncbi:hypothetical protein P7K49_032955 [Saguinus oedipus]|uniref:Megakaryocyte-associated tyrosine kinase n=1 Tax=Saguinus oedipus TaxID=9490 RepID=A0ABQ9TQJ6_SAGOE|nr:hypothetical protein P7K49_032955 [Saguinus oedipus]